MTKSEANKKAWVVFHNELMSWQERQNTLTSALSDAIEKAMDTLEYETKKALLEEIRDEVKDRFDKTGVLELHRCWVFITTFLWDKHLRPINTKGKQSSP